MLPLCDFFDCPVLSCPYLFSQSCAQVEPLDRLSRFMAQAKCFRARMVLWRPERWVTIFGENMPPKPAPLQMGVNRQFQAKRQNVKIAISPKLQIRSRPNLRIKLIPTIALCGWSNITQIKSNMAAGRYSEKKWI